MRIAVPPELWANSLMPEGVIEQWLKPDGCFVLEGEPIAKVRIEDAVHEIVAPASGWLTTQRATNAVIDPGMVIAHVGRDTIN